MHITETTVTTLRGISESADVFTLSMSHVELVKLTVLLATVRAEDLSPTQDQITFYEELADLDAMEEFAEDVQNMFSDASFV